MSDSVGSVSVEVVPDARGWSEKLRAQLRDQKVQVKADADTTEAETELDEVARDRRSTIKVNVDKNDIEKGAGALDSFIGKLGLLPALAITAGSALIPLVGVLGGVAVALAAPIAVAGGGATLFAFLGALAAKDTEKQLKAIDTLRTKLGTLTKGTAEYAATQKQLHDAQAALTPQQVKFAAAQDTLTTSFQKFLAGKAGIALLGVMAQGMTMLAHILPEATPLITSVGGALSSLLRDADHAAQSQGFKHFIDQFANLAGRDIRAGGHILGDLATGVGDLVVQLDKHLSGDVLHGLETLTSNFADWASSKSARQDIHGFIEYFHQNGPTVAHTIGQVAKAIGKIVEALAPLGPPVLHIISGIADAISSIPTPVLTGLAAATAGLVAFQKVGGFKAASLLGGLGSKGGLVGGIASKAGVVPVFVTNPGFGGGTGVPGVPGGEPVGVPGGSTGTGKGTLGGLLLGVGAVSAIDIGTTGILKKLYGQLFGGALGMVYRGLLNLPDPSVIPQQAELWKKIAGRVTGQNKGPGAMPVDSKPTGFLALQARDPQVHLTSTTNALNAVKALEGKVSAGFDIIGHSAAANSASASHAIAGLHAELGTLPVNKQINILVRDQAAMAALQRLREQQIPDKFFTVYERQSVQRVYAPGGGRGQPIANSGGGAGRGLSGGSGGGAGRTHVHVHLDDTGRNTLSGFLDDNYRANRDADQGFDRARAGM